MRKFVLLVAMLVSMNCIAQEWQLKKMADGVKVYTKAIENSDFSSFKAEMEVEYSVEKIEYILFHLDLYPNLFPDTKELKIVERINDSSFVQYSITEVPWPMDDRDGYYQMNFLHKANGVLRIESYARPDFKPENEDMVRIPVSDSSWDIIPQPNGKTKVIYTVAAQPGGELPAMFVNAAAVEIPHQTFVNLKEVLKTL